MRQSFGWILLAVGLVAIAAVAYINSNFNGMIRPFASHTLLLGSWETYKQDYINDDGRVIDDSGQESISTSEGQSYALLRAVWVDDRETFDLVMQWTQDNLQRDNETLFSWRWGQREDGSYGTLANGGENAASDADADIALALILAGRRWNDEAYTNTARGILDQLWERETGVANGKRYMVAGNWAKNETELVLNPSYFAPYAWREFATVDDRHDWLSLIDPAYELLDGSAGAALDTGRGNGLVPDWITVDVATGVLRPTGLDGLTTNYSYDAMRTPWRVALDYQWNNEPRALEHLQEQYAPLKDAYTRNGRLVGSYSHDGTPLVDYENPTMYATALGIFLFTDRETADQLYQQKIIQAYSNATNNFDGSLPYYDQNWLWFAEALYQDYTQTFR